MQTTVCTASLAQWYPLVSTFHHIAMCNDVLQGSSAPSLFMEDSAEQHAALRKGFSRFFSAENIEAVVTQLVSQVSQQSDAICQQAAERGSASVDIAHVADHLIDSIVRKVRLQSSPAGPSSFQRGCLLAFDASQPACRPSCLGDVTVMHAAITWRAPLCRKTIVKAEVACHAAPTLCQGLPLAISIGATL